MLLYPWLNTIYTKILSSYFTNQGHHALIFYSSWNQGEDLLINFIARWLMCSNPYETKYCNVCQNCYLMNTEQHPDYYKLDLRSDDVQSVGIDRIRICIDSIRYSTRYSKSKVIFIKHIECLTNQAIYVLLKTLEEPPKNTYFFLKTREYMKIPITLLSRCIKWSLDSPSESLGLTWLMKNLKITDTISAQTALRLCQKAPIEARSILQSKNWKKRLELYKVIDQIIITNGNFLEFLPYFDVNQDNNTFLYWFITLLMDALKMQQKITQHYLVNLDQLKLINVIANNWDALSLNNQVKQWLILFCYFQKFDNINYKLLLTHRLLNWQKDLIETYS